MPRINKYLDAQICDRCTVGCVDRKDGVALPCPITKSIILTCQKAMGVKSGKI